MNSIEKNMNIYIPGSSNCVKFVPFHPQNLPKGSNFTHLEDPGIYLYILLRFPGNRYASFLGGKSVVFFHVWIVNNVEICWTSQVRQKSQKNGDPINDLIPFSHHKLLQRIILGHLKPKTWMLRNNADVYLFEESKFPTNLVMFYSLFLLSIFLGYLPKELPAVPIKTSVLTGFFPGFLVHFSTGTCET